MSKIIEDIEAFLKHFRLLKGDEKGEAQVFCDRLFKAFGHEGYKEAGATLEDRIKKQSTGGTSFADLVWKPRVLIEMKKRGEKLQLHYDQAFEYWLNSVPNRPRYVVLCNFDELWIYDFDKQLGEPIDKVSTLELPKRYTALNFLFAGNRDPIFNNDREAVSRVVAAKLGELFRELVKRKKNPVEREDAQRFLLQIVVAMFAEDLDLLPSGTVTSIARDCLSKGQSSFDLFGGLFQQMNNPKPAPAGRFVGVRYFNGGLFSKIKPIELTEHELELIGGDFGASTTDWSKVNPAIFGTLFEQSMDAVVQHRHGRHYTSEADIQRIVGPTIVRPFREKIDKATTIKELVEIRQELASFRVLDPSCGSGNFLYVAFRELARLDIRLMTRLQLNFSHKEFENRAKLISAISPKQFFGIDNDSFGTELAKVSLMFAKKLALDEAIAAFSESEKEYGKGTDELFLSSDSALPLDNLDQNIVCEDALFLKWPAVDAIVGNPPYQSKNKIQQEMGRAYLNRLRDRYPDVDGRADYCAYWFKIAHENLKPGDRAGLVGTNTIRQNYTREAGLDYIVANGGTITEAVSTMIWPGAAVVHVSIVNWIKGDMKGNKRLYIQEGDDISSGWRHADLSKIGPSLSYEIDVSEAKTIHKNAKLGKCFQGQTHGHEGFLVAADDAANFLKKDKSYAAVLKPYLIADELIGQVEHKINRYVIDFSGLSLLDAKKYKELFSQLSSQVLPDREKAAEKEAERNKKAKAEDEDASVNRHHANFLNQWWRMSYSRDDMMTAISGLSRYIACGRVTRRPIFEFISSEINPNDALQVFAYEDDYTFGILQSSIHWSWFVARCSTLKADFRYTSNTVFDSFAWPQNPNEVDVKEVADSAIELRELRKKLREKHGISLRELYRSLEIPGKNPLRDAQEKLDSAVRQCYGIKKNEDVLAYLLKLNFEVVQYEAVNKPIAGPGLPAFIKNPKKFISKDCIKS
ncbi:MAG: class I SAM-dependent DNA methyltransferase [Nitrospira sp.]|nr:class I SAM-dependent DNA methyltransferase [Nitrospira sp.]MBX3513127.1 class I SAM-dependent DNA methyltransferase [Xanthobacteraceae bacterium]